MAVTTDRSGVMSIVSNGLWSNYVLGGSCYVLSGSLDTTDYRLTITVQTRFFTLPNGRSGSNTGDYVYEIHGDTITQISGGEISAIWSGSDSTTRITSYASITNIVIEPL